MEIPGVTKSTVEYLRTQIITGQLRAAQRLNEQVLSNDLQISRAPLREAFRVLEEDQLVVSNPRKGCYVAKISLQDFIEVYLARDMIESYAIDILKQRGLTKLPEVERALATTKNSSMPSDSERPEEKLAYLLSFAEFHNSIVDSSSNKQLIHFYRKIGFHLARYQFMYAYRPGLTRNSQKDHEAIYALISEGKHDEAKELTRGHIKSFVQLLSPRIKELT